MTNFISFTKLFCGVHSSQYYQHGQHVEGVIIIGSFSSMKQGDPLKGLLFVLAHYQALLKTIMRTPNSVFPSPMDDTHIVGSMSEIIHTFNHLFDPISPNCLRVKVLKCKFWSPLGF